MVYKVIDPHCHIIPHREPVWGWGPNFTVERLIDMMDRDYDVMGEIKHVEKAVVMSSKISMTKTWTASFRRLRKSWISFELS